MPVKNKIFLWKRKTTAFWQKTRHFGKITAFTEFDGNHGFRDFRDYLLSLVIVTWLLLTGNDNDKYKTLSISN